MKKLTVLFLACIILLFSGCATAESGRDTSDDILTNFSKEKIYKEYLEPLFYGRILFYNGTADNIPPNQYAMFFYINRFLNCSDGKYEFNTENGNLIADGHEYTREELKIDKKEVYDYLKKYFVIDTKRMEERLSSGKNYRCFDPNSNKYDMGYYTDIDEFCLFANSLELRNVEYDESNGKIYVGYSYISKFENAEKMPTLKTAVFSAEGDRLIYNENIFIGNDYFDTYYKDVTIEYKDEKLNAAQVLAIQLGDYVFQSLGSPVTGSTILTTDVSQADLVRFVASSFIFRASQRYPYSDILDYTENYSYIPNMPNAEKAVKLLFNANQTAIDIFEQNLNDSTVFYTDTTYIGSNITFSTSAKYDDDGNISVTLSQRSLYEEPGTFTKIITFEVCQSDENTEYLRFISAWVG
jgi:hypothetical protein